MYDKDQAPFLNAVAKIETEKSPEALFGISRNTEIALKKNTPHKYGPRTIDLDILLYDDVILSKPVLSPSARLRTGSVEVSKDDTTLQLPHPRMHERRFVLEPLCELIDPHKKHPQYGETWIELLTKNCDQECEKTAIPL